MRWNQPCVDTHIEIVVADTGVGINPEIIPQIFDRFRQADSSVTRSYGGLGLGLSIALHLTQLHGGTLNVSSPGSGQGAIFVVKLPLLSATTVSPELPIEVAQNSISSDRAI